MLKITPVDDSLQTNGAWAEYHGVELLIARSGNSKYKSAFRHKIKPYKKQIDNGTLPPETSDRILSETIAETVLLGWRGLEADGKDVPYTLDNAIDLLTSDPDCRDFVMSFSEDMENFFKKDDEELKKK